MVFDVAKPPYSPYQFIDRTQPNVAKGQFVYYTATLKELIQAHIDGDQNSPFQTVYIGGTRSYDEGNNRLLLESVVFGTSGYVSLKMKSNFQALFYVRTENNDYFEDNAQDAISSDWSDTTDARQMLAEEGFPSVWVQDDAEFSDSRTVFGLDSGDYFSIDVDGESSNVAQMRVRLSGVDYFNNKEISNETYVWKLWIRKWEADLENPDFVKDDGDQDDGDQDDGDQDDDQNDPISDDCPDGFVYDPDVGACVPIEDDEDDDDDDKDDTNPIDDVSGGAVVLVAIAIGLIIYVAVKA